MKTLSIILLCAAAPLASARAQQPPVNPDAATIADFNKRVEVYVALHDKVDARLPEPAADGRPEAVVEHQRAFAKMMQQERSHAQAGDILTKPMRNVV